ncbi:hypothetical protein YTPLAS18_04290 [Nitrospira sp.]|nr:hypothetical protein YTPLAS18_04290 [Nitrospira sp.]
MPTSESQIRALIRLLSDEDERIVKTITGKLIDMGSSAVPLLQEAEVEDPELGDRVSTILEEIRGSRLEQELASLVAQGGDKVDLEGGAFLMARYAYPDLDQLQWMRYLDRMAADVRACIGLRASGEETVKILGRYLFTELGYSGNTRNYYEPDNSFLNRVLERRTGIPISLSTIYLLIGQRLGLPVVGIGMPGHFLVKYDSERYKIFIDCFNGGTLLTERNCLRFLTEAGYGFDDRYLQQSSNRAILIRTVKNLVAIYGKLDEPLKKARLIRFMSILEGQSPEEELA